MRMNKSSDLVLHTNPPTCWQARADDSRLLGTKLIVAPLWAAIVIGLISCILVGLDPTMERVIDLVATGLAALPLILFLVLWGTYPEFTSFVTLLVECIKERPVADETEVEDVETVLAFLRRFAWIHRSACRRQKLDYDQLVAACAQSRGESGPCERTL